MFITLFECNLRLKVMFMYNLWALLLFLPPPPPFYFIFINDYDREFYADSEKYKNIDLKINRKCSKSMSKF